MVLAIISRELPKKMEDLHVGAYFPDKDVYFFRKLFSNLTKFIPLDRHRILEESSKKARKWLFIKNPANSVRFVRKKYKYEKGLIMLSDVCFYSMQQGELKKQRWIDYSSDGTSSLISSDASLIRNPELEKLDKLNSKQAYVWLKVQCNGVSEQTRRKVKDIRREDSKSAVYEAEDYQGYDVRVTRDKARTFLEKSIPGTRGLVISISRKNYQTDRSSKKRSSHKSQSQKRTFRKNGGGSREPKSIRYVDKETGQEPNNKQIHEERIASQKIRIYSKREANQLGEQLGNFRSKDKVQPKEATKKEYDLGHYNKNEEKPKIGYVKSEKKFQNSQRSKSKQSSNAWKRKQTSNSKKNQVGKSPDGANTNYQRNRDVRSPKTEYKREQKKRYRAAE